MPDAVMLITISEFSLSDTGTINSALLARVEYLEAENKKLKGN